MLPPAKRQRLAGAAAAPVSGAEGAPAVGVGGVVGVGSGLGRGVIVVDTDAWAEV